jgi:hypothetical protein
LIKGRFEIKLPEAGAATVGDPFAVGAVIGAVHHIGMLREQSVQ